MNRLFLWLHKATRPPIYCRLCVQYNDHPRLPAVTIWNGDALCEQHYHDEFMHIIEFGVETPTYRKITQMADRVDRLADQVCQLTAVVKEQAKGNTP